MMNMDHELKIMILLNLMMIVYYKIITQLQPVMMNMDCKLKVLLKYS